ncbi:meteorin-like protein [Genypterus blacodes]|uniref:meteorin-like protein n=1 Tax=Genypterus blacodes TaxID=154954 RepID=UPI003F771126
MLWPWTALWIPAVLLCRAAAQYSSDQCSWRGSGLSHESHSRDVEQVYLRCSQGSLEWLYPTGAIIINLRPNTEPSSGGAADLHVCIKPHTRSQGSRVYLEHEGDLKLLLGEKEQAQGATRCYSMTEGALFVEAVPHTDISRRITAFQYELVSSQGPGDLSYLNLHPGTATCQPCSDEELLMAACTSDFVGRGTIQSVETKPSPPTSGTNGRSHVAVVLSRLFKQKNRVFASGGARGRRWIGSVHVPTQCGVRAGGDDDYLFTGSIHFGEAWLGCAPRYKDFEKLYATAEEAGTNPCQIDTD